ncbi:UNVERIFIED_CONTAM: hypothetical protein K2H54_021127 [Gekko kuhli]
MERKEQRSGSPGRKSGRGGGGGGPAEPEAVVQRTQVVLLAGESWEPNSAQAVLSSFAHHVLPPTTSPGCAADRRAVAPTTGEPSLPRPPSAAPPPPGQASGQLIFFLCRPSSLRERLSRLREVLQGVREQSRGAPAALVGVIVQPREDEEAEARQRLEDLLREVFQAEGAAPVEVHTAIFKPGRPQGALEVKRVAGGVPRLRSSGEAWVLDEATAIGLRGLESLTRPSRKPYVGWGWGLVTASTMWLDKSKLMQIFGAMLSVGTVAYGSYYFYYKPPA